MRQDGPGLGHRGHRITGLLPFTLFKGITNFMKPTNFSRSFKGPVLMAVRTALHCIPTVFFEVGMTCASVLNLANELLLCQSLRPVKLF
jgi:hypothetical protein